MPDSGFESSVTYPRQSDTAYVAVQALGADGRAARHLGDREGGGQVSAAAAPAPTGATLKAVDVRAGARRATRCC